MATITDKLGRRGVALLSLLLVSVVIGFLIKFEQIALLYVLATLSLVGLLLVVGFADLENVGIDGDHGFRPDTE